MKKFLLCLFLINHFVAYPFFNDAVIKVSELSNLHINDFTQDSLGYMWIATSRGLNKYNGYEYIHYFHEKGNASSLPNDHVTSLFTDSRNLVWIGTNSGMASYDGRRDLFTRHVIEGDHVSRCVYDFVEDRRGNIWICMMDGLGVVSSPDNPGKRVLDYKNMDPELGVFKSLQVDKEDENTLWIVMEKGILKYSMTDNTCRIVLKQKEFMILDLYVDQMNRFWLATNQGVRCMDGKTGQLQELPQSVREKDDLLQDEINRIEKIGSSSLLFATNRNLYVLDEQTQQLLYISDRTLQPQIKLQKITSCYTDSFGNLWVGTFNNGYTVLYRNKKKFNQDVILSDLFKDTFITAIASQKNTDYLWIGTRYDGLFRYDRKTHQHVRYDLHSNKLFDIKRSDFVQSLFCDSGGRMWVGLSDGVCVLNTGESGILSSRYFKGLSGVVSIAEDKEHKIWIGTERSGLFIFSDPDKDPLSIFPESSKNIPRILSLSSGKMLVSFFSENVYMMDSETFERFTIAESDSAINRILSSCITMCETSPNNVWVGAYNSGMANINLTTEKYKIYDAGNGLPSNDVLGIVPDNYSYLWLSTSFGLSRFDTKSEKFRNFFSIDGTQGNQYHEKACFKTPDQMIFMGGNYGLTFFNPQEIVLDTTQPVVVLENLKILNQDVKPSKENVLKESLVYTKDITLNYRQNVFTIDYSAIGFNGYQKYVYAYKLEGLDSDWNYAGGYRRATYSNLNPGMYTFKVRVQNEDGLWSDHAAVLNIKVKAAPWFTVWAYIFYILLLAFVIYMFFRLSVSIKMGKISLDLLKKDQQREQQLTQLKINFFNNVSHELQTPLSLIYGPVISLLKGSRSESDQHLLSIIEMNVNRLLKLISQLLDFGKMEADTMELKVKEQDLVMLLRHIRKRFAYYARQKDIAFSLHSSQPYYISYFDEDKIDKIMNNLLSNAFKYTPTGGEVEVNIGIIPSADVSALYVAANVVEGDYIEITVRDSGPGIPASELPGLFSRYKRLNLKTGEKDAYQGTGLGLSYTKNLVSVHKGFIKVTEGEERGMLFSFVLPLNKQLYSGNEICRDKQEEGLVKFHPGPVNPVALPESHRAGEQDTEEKQYTLLVVDDDPGIQDFVKYLLQKKYNILQAFDASEGYHILQDEAPDIVITDVLMPGMNGYDFCRKIKTNPDLSHVVVIILTAKGSMNEHIEGLSVGADAYVNKPFDESYLLAVIQNLVCNRERMKGIFNTGIIPEDEALSGIDRKFMERLYQLLDERLDEVELNVNNLSRELAFSRSSFYRKIKALTGESPNTFVRIYRLNKAKELLLKGEMSISEVASCTGFSTLSHFSTCFKKQFGVSPTDFKNKENLPGS